MCRDGKNPNISHIFTTFLIIHLTRPKYFAGLTEKTPLVGIKNSTQSLSFNVSEEKILISNGVNEASTKYLNIIIAKCCFILPYRNICLQWVIVLSNKFFCKKRKRKTL